MGSIFAMATSVQWLIQQKTADFENVSRMKTFFNWKTRLPLHVLCTVRWRKSDSRLKASKTNKNLSTPTHTEKPSTSKQNGATSKVESPYGGILENISNAFKADELGWEISLLGIPAIISLAAEPIASLVDTAFVGHIGSTELAAVGVSISIFNIVSKLFNIPLLNVTTSFVAEDEAFKDAGEKVLENQDEAFKDAGEKVGENQVYNIQGKKYVRKENSSLKEKDMHREVLVDGNDRLQLPAVSTALVLAAGLGTVEAFALTLGAGYFLDIMGVPADSPMRLPAEQYLSLRALGAPGTVISLAVQGVFRGFKDTKTPLYATGAGNLLNTVLDPIFMFTLGFGVSGAAFTTAVSEYFIAFLLLWCLNKEVVLLPSNIRELRFDRYLKSGGLLLGRTVAVLVTMTLGTSMAARQGAVPMAAHQICLQVWLSVSLLTDSLAIAGQALVATAVSKRDYKKAKIVAFRVLQIGLGAGVASAVILFAGFAPFSKLFTNDPSVLEIMASGVLFVAGTQPINALAFVFDGLYYGVSDFAFATYSMIIIGAISSVWLVLAPSTLGLGGVWTGLGLFMVLRMAAGFWRLGDKNGPWFFLRQAMEETEIGT